MYISAIENTRFKRIVTPGDQLIINAELKKFKLNTCKISAQISVDKNIVAEEKTESLSEKSGWWSQ